MELQIALNPALADFFRQFVESTPYVLHEYVEVTFSGANTDLDIRTSLRPADPDDVQYTLVRADRATSLFHDQSASRKKWQTGFVILRSSAANANCRILLTVRR